MTEGKPEKRKYVKRQDREIVMTRVRLPGLQHWLLMNYKSEKRHRNLSDTIVDILQKSPQLKEVLRRIRRDAETKHY